MYLYILEKKRALTQKKTSKDVKWGICCCCCCGGGGSWGESINNQDIST